MIDALQTCVDCSEQPLDELWSIAEQLPSHVRSLVDEDNLPSEQDIERELEWIRQLPSLIVQEQDSAKILNEVCSRFPVWHLIS
ncbi:MAG: hypothetical protein IPK32_22485 [Verrucomicrobiaceae bacterium]|nr:hypothetical protein [Verrucomicrobiaceae bacterium]